MKKYKSITISGQIVNLSGTVVNHYQAEHEKALSEISAKNGEIIDVITTQIPNGLNRIVGYDVQTTITYKIEE